METLPHIALALGVISILCLMASPTVGTEAVFIVKPFIDASWEFQFPFGLHPAELSPSAHSFYGFIWRPQGTTNS
jgi:hypothetical protein